MEGGDIGSQCNWHVISDFANEEKKERTQKNLSREVTVASQVVEARVVGGGRSWHIILLRKKKKS